LSGNNFLSAYSLGWNKTEEGEKPPQLFSLNARKVNGYRMRIKGPLLQNRTSFHWYFGTICFECQHTPSKAISCFKSQIARKTLFKREEEDLKYETLIKKTFSDLLCVKGLFTPSLEDFTNICKV